LNEQNFDLNELANSLDSMFAWRCKEKGLGWELSWDGDSVVAVRGDASKLTQVLINLLGNAVKFSDAGMVSLRIAKEHEQHYRFEVRDTGVGIPAAEQEQLFQAFQQGEAGAQRGGTGLGLAIARQLVEFMGGELHLDSQSGQGSTFAFAIALAKGSPDALRENERSSTKLKLKSDVHVRALVADDVEDNRTILRRVLEQVGLEVELAKNGREALEKIENGSFEIIFLDIRMPVMDGREVVRAVRKRPEWHALRVVAVSASVLDHERNDFLAAGFDDFVGKPFEEAQIVECLRSQLQVELVAVASESAEPAHTPEQVPDLSTLVLPATLHAQLLQSAKLSRVTEIDEGLRKLDRLGTQERQLAEYLRVVLRRYDIDGIVQILEGVTHE
ncbi:MAG: CheY-like chemotaxis protein/anti-sigma regulatory factor (Ser/Thr protein kinase), partial [Candidatus Latescibacterota bacterium]